MVVVTYRCKRALPMASHAEDGELPKGDELYDFSVNYSQALSLHPAQYTRTKVTPFKT